MTGPIDGQTLVIADLGGVEIDDCPLCRGVARPLRIKEAEMRELPRANIRFPASL
ncbi:MAG: zf-TFIIB domain-containing protein [Pseudomonadota bacterium]